MSRSLEGRPGALEWDKEGIAVRTVRASDELPDDVALEGTPTVRIDKLTRGSEPEDWVDVTDDFTISGITIVNSVADDETTNLGTNQAVQFQIAADPTLQWVGKVPLIIHF